jgi:hypothetical protein
MSSHDSAADYNAIADRIYIEGWALALIFGAVDQALVRSWGAAVACGVMSAICQFIVIRWAAWIKTHPENPLLRSLNAVATNAGWWVATAMVFVAYLALSNVGPRWLERQNLPPSADEIAAAVVRALPHQSQPTGFTQQQVDEKIAAATAPITAQLDRMVGRYGPLDSSGQPMARNPYASGPILLQSKYTHQEASDLIAKISAIRVAISDRRLFEMPDDIFPPVGIGHALSPPVQGVAKIKADGIDATIKRITTSRENLGKLQGQLQQAYSDPTYGHDLNRIIGNPWISDMDLCLAIFEGTLEKAKKYNAAPELLDDVLAAPGERCIVARRNFRAWDGSIRYRLDDAEKALRDYL